MLNKPKSPPYITKAPSSDLSNHRIEINQLNYPVKWKYKRSAQNRD